MVCFFSIRCNVLRRILYTFCWLRLIIAVFQQMKGLCFWSQCVLHIADYHCMKAVYFWTKDHGRRIYAARRCFSLTSMKRGKRRWPKRTGIMCKFRCDFQFLWVPFASRTETEELGRSCHEHRGFPYAMFFFVFGFATVFRYISLKRYVDRTIAMVCLSFAISGAHFSKRDIHCIVFTVAALYESISLNGIFSRMRQGVYLA